NLEKSLEETEATLTLMQISKGVVLLENNDTRGLLDLLEGRRRAERLPDMEPSCDLVWSHSHAACANHLVQVVGHDDGVQRIDFSKDGKKMLTVSTQEVRLWD